ncbi:MAG TPA: hypothetical protein VHZ09_05040 [Acidobacteriaceae bacterium]|jgi:hypothetical protein|nr:hypothetical protein [Acidobacteriaceae bacterium]
MNWKPILVHFAWLATLVIVVEAGTIWVCSTWFWTPIQRRYMPAYIWCSLPVITPAIVEVNWIWKIGRHGKRELATDDDADASGDGSGVALSQSSREAGWKRLLKGPPEQVPAELLRPGLADLAFDGQGLWSFLLLPETCGLVVLCYGLYGCIRLANRLMEWAADLDGKRQRPRWVEPSPNLFDSSFAMAQEMQFRLSKMYRSAERLIKAHRAVTTVSVAKREPPTMPASFPLPLFGVHSATGDGYLWTDADEIE